MIWPLLMCLLALRVQSRNPNRLLQTNTPPSATPTVSFQKAKQLFGNLEMRLDNLTTRVGSIKMMLNGSHPEEDIAQQLKTLKEEAMNISGENQEAYTSVCSSLTTEQKDAIMGRKVKINMNCLGSKFIITQLLAQQITNSTDASVRHWRFFQNTKPRNQANHQNISNTFQDAQADINEKSTNIVKVEMAIHDISSTPQIGQNDVKALRKHLGTLYVLKKKIKIIVENAEDNGGLSVDQVDELKKTGQILIMDIKMNTEKVRVVLQREDKDAIKLGSDAVELSKMGK